MSNVADVRATVDGHLNEMEQTSAAIMALGETLGASAQSIRSAVDRTSGHSSYVSNTQALFGPGNDISKACTALNEAIAMMRTVTNAW